MYNLSDFTNGYGHYTNDNELRSYKSKYLKSLFDGSNELGDTIKMKQQLIKGDCNISEIYKKDPQYAIQALDVHGMSLEFMEDNIKDDYNCVITAVVRTPYAWNFISDRLKENKDIALAALGYVIKSPSMMINEQFMEHSHKLDPDLNIDSETERWTRHNNNVPQLNRSELYHSLIDELKNDIDIVNQAIKTKAIDISNTPNEFQNNKEYVLKVIEAHPCQYNKLPKELKVDKDIILTALNTDRMMTLNQNTMFMGNRIHVYNNIIIPFESIEYDLELALELLKYDPDCYGRFPIDQKLNKIVARLALELKSENYSEFPKELKDQMNEIRKDIGEMDEDPSLLELLDTLISIENKTKKVKSARNMF